MTTRERQTYLLKTAQKNGFVSIPKSAEKLGVSVETVRRDINALCESKQLKKTHGGATPIKSPFWKDVPFKQRVQQASPGKVAICRDASKMIRDGDIIALDCGATTEYLVSQLQGIHNVTFVVCSLRIATILCDKVNSGDISATVIMTGGQIFTGSHRSYTISALETVDQYHYDIMFASATGLTESGASTTSTNQAMYTQHLMQRSAKCVLVLESHKLGKHALIDFAKPVSFDRIITDDQTPFPSGLRETLEGSHVDVTVVSCEEFR